MIPVAMLNTVLTDTLELAYEESGKPTGSPVILLHGFPDDSKERQLIPVAGHLFPREAPDAVIAAIRRLSAIWETMLRLRRFSWGRILTLTLDILRWSTAVRWFRQITTTRFELCDSRTKPDQSFALQALLDVSLHRATHCCGCTYLKARGGRQAPFGYSSGGHALQCARPPKKEE